MVHWLKYKIRKIEFVWTPGEVVHWARSRYGLKVTSCCCILWAMRDSSSHTYLHLWKKSNCFARNWFRGSLSPRNIPVPRRFEYCQYRESLSKYFPAFPSEKINIKPMSKMKKKKGKYVGMDLIVTNKIPRNSYHISLYFYDPYSNLKNNFKDVKSNFVVQ